MFGSSSFSEEDSQRLIRIEQKLDRLLALLDGATTPPTSNSAGPFNAIWQLAEQGQLIEAVKQYRELTSCGLKEAKDAVEAYLAARGAR